jgi:hypothetical protein
MSWQVKQQKTSKTNIICQITTFVVALCVFSGRLKGARDAETKTPHRAQTSKEADDDYI